MAHACSYTGPTYVAVADPAVRIAQVVRAFESHGALTSACAADSAVALTAISATIAQLSRDPGRSRHAHDSLGDSSTEPNVQPSCTVTVERDGVEQPVPPCPAAGTCFEVVADAAACAGTSDHLRLVVHGPSPRPSSIVRARCDVP
ncbi:MAG: hypothetical protein IPQ07_35765 [Myxococcales bacterium]|nr:hypothetical protein [Myxococcales bacterium]